MSDPKKLEPVVCPKCGVVREDFKTSDDQGYLQYGYRLCAKCFAGATEAECAAHDKAHWAKKV